MLEVGRVNFKHVGARLMLEVRRARLLQAWLIYQSAQDEANHLDWRSPLGLLWPLPRALKEV